MVPEVGIAPTSPRLQRGANLPQLLGGACARTQLVVPAGNAPASSGYQPGAGGRVQTLFELRDEFQLRLHTKPACRTKNNVQLRRRSNAKTAIRSVALAKEQLALIASDWFHGISFR